MGVRVEGLAATCHGGRVLSMHQQKTESPCLQWDFNSGGEKDSSGGDEYCKEKKHKGLRLEESHANKSPER